MCQVCKEECRKFVDVRDNDVDIGKEMGKRKEIANLCKLFYTVLDIHCDQDPLPSLHYVDVFLTNPDTILPPFPAIF